MIKIEDIPIDVSWKNLLSDEWQKPYIHSLETFLNEELSKGFTIFPPKEKIFRSLYLTPYDRVKVVIIGQDPYHGDKQAEGLSFSVPENIPQPPSLKNIFKELHRDLLFNIPKTGSLVSWAEQGVLLLNSTLTVRKGEPKSHFGKGWEIFTDKIVNLLCKKQTPVVFMLWGNSAIEKVKHFNDNSTPSHHMFLTAPHPSPLSAYHGFLGCGHFSKANEFLKKHNQTPIIWQI